VVPPFVHSKKEIAMSQLQPALALAARLLLAFLFLLEGYFKIHNYGDVADYMTEHSVAPSLLPLVIATELGGGACVALGLLTRPVAFGMAGFALLTAILFHNDFADPEQLTNFLKNFAIAGGFLALVSFGGGAWSLDALLSRRRSWQRQPHEKAR
jgi:putative oxidoreductase